MKLKLGKKYKAGDLVTVKLTEYSANNLNINAFDTCFNEKNIIKHAPAPEPLTGTLILNIYGDGTAKAFKDRAEADEAAKQKRLAKHVTRLACHVIKWTEGQGL